MTERRVLRVTRHLAIPFDEFEWAFATSGGPGGQHANRAATRAEVRFHVERSPSLGPRQRRRLVDRLGPVVRASAADERSQARNREVALERLREKLVTALQVPRPRQATVPGPGARRRRVEEKRRRAAVKRLRRPPEPD